MELVIAAGIISVLVKLIFMCKWSWIIVGSLLIGILLTIISCNIPVEIHTIYQHGVRGPNGVKPIPMQISHAPEWLNIMFLSFYFIPSGSLIGYAVYMMIFFWVR